MKLLWEKFSSIYSPLLILEIKIFCKTQWEKLLFYKVLLHFYYLNSWLLYAQEFWEHIRGSTHSPCDSFICTSSNQFVWKIVNWILNYLHFLIKSPVLFHSNVPTIYITLFNLTEYVHFISSIVSYSIEESCIILHLYHLRR